MIECLHMQFNSYGFIFYFLPITILLYYLVNRIKPVAGKLVIIIASIFFYSYGRINMLFFLGISILINYISACAVKKCRTKALFVIPIVVNICLLLYFKYLNFAIINFNVLTNRHIEVNDIILPLGISFYTIFVNHKVSHALI